MQRSGETPVNWLPRTRVSENAGLVCTQIKSHGRTLRVFSVGDMGLDEVLATVSDPFLQKNCEIIKSEKKIRVGRLPLRVGGKIKSVYVKEHNILSFGHRFASIFCASAAMRSLAGAGTLLQSGYATARPVAAVEYRRWGVLSKSVYLSEEIAGAKTVTKFWCEDLVSLEGAAGYVGRRAVLRSLARVFASLHGNGIYHNDLKASNILVLARGVPAKRLLHLIDLQGLKKCLFVSKRRRIKNLAQLNRTLGPHLSRSDKLFFFNAYGGCEDSNRREKRDLVQSIVKETTRQIVREKARHQAGKNYPILDVRSAAAGLGEKL
jgi:tRNA A-37 threonylcarbamoyl transferase component Bud32